MLCENYKGQNQLMLHMITSQSRDHKIIINKYSHCDMSALIQLTIIANYLMSKTLL